MVRRQIACSIGGNVAENSGGVHCLKYGLTTNHLLRHDARADDRGDAIAGLFAARKSDQKCARYLRFFQDAHGHFRDHA